MNLFQKIKFKFHFELFYYYLLKRIDCLIKGDTKKFDKYDKLRKKHFEALNIPKNKYLFIFRKKYNA